MSPSPVSVRDPRKQDSKYNTLTLFNYYAQFDYNIGNNYILLRYAPSI